MSDSIADSLGRALFAPLPPLPMTIQERFEEYHKLNPHVYKRLVESALKLKEKGVDICGIRMLWEVMRWRSMMKVYGDEVYKYSDNFTSRYARLIMSQEPELDGFFHTKPIRTE